MKYFKLIIFCLVLAWEMKGIFILPEFSSARRVRNLDQPVTIAEAFDILKENGIRISKRVYEELVRYLGGEDVLEKIISEFEIDEARLRRFDSPITYDEKNHILSIKGKPHSSGFQVRFLVFFDQTESYVTDIAFKVSSSEEDGEDNILKDIFIRLPRNLPPDEQSFIPPRISSLIEETALYRSRWEWPLDSYPSEEILLMEPVVSDELELEALRRMTEANPIINYIIRKREFISELAIDAYLYHENREAMGEYLDSIKAIFKRYELSEEPILESTFAHEFLHHILLNKLYKGEIDKVYEERIEEKRSFDESYLTFKERQRLRISPQREDLLLKEISEAGRENMFIYMAENHPDLTAEIIRVYFLDPDKPISGIEIMDETIAWLFGIFAEPSNRGMMIAHMGGDRMVEVRVKSKDVEIFADLGIVPDWMRPSELGFDQEFINGKYYQLLEQTR